jgi:hypothetical protein
MKLIGRATVPGRHDTVLNAFAIGSGPSLHELHQDQHDLP